jgi:hypothetical protein
MFVEHKPLTLPTIPAPRTVEELLLMAARWIEEHGWSPNGYEQARNRYCAIEAIGEVSRNQNLRDGAYQELSKNIGRGITYWNAHSTEDEVIATMRQVARRLT